MKSDRITPAGTGKSLSQCFLQPKNRDHPRRYGEKSPPFELKAPGTGSPSQVRGKGKLDGVIPAGVRITPTGVGKRMRVMV